MDLALLMTPSRACLDKPRDEKIQASKELALPVACIATHYVLNICHTYWDRQAQ